MLLPPPPPEKVTVCVDCRCEHSAIGDPRCPLSSFGRLALLFGASAFPFVGALGLEGDMGHRAAAAREHPHHRAELWREADRLVAAIGQSRLPGRRRVVAKLAIVRDALRATGDDGVISRLTASLRSARNDQACAAVALGHMFLAGQIDCDVAVSGIEYELMEWRP